MSTLQSRALDLIAGIPTLRALAAPSSSRPHRRTRGGASTFDYGAAHHVHVRWSGTSATLGVAW
jgi:hypothetical protein